MKERSFVYAGDITVPDGGGLVKLSVQLTSADFAAQFPFVLRAMAAFSSNPDTEGSTVFFQVRRYDGSFIDNQPQRLKTILNARYPTDWIPRWPGELYPATSVIEVDCYNEGDDPAAITLYFFGVHLIPDGFETPYIYPATYTETFFDYVTTETFASGEQSAANRMLNIRDDADFCLRGIAGGAESDFEGPVDLRVRVKSLAGVPYSNVPIRWQFVMGNLIAEKPRWLWPPIYLPRNSYLLLDWVRDDAGGAESRIRVRWIGSKIQEVCR